MALVSSVVLGSSSVRPLSVVSDRHTVGLRCFVRALAWRRRISRVMVTSMRVMAAMEPAAVPAMAPRDRVLEDLATRAYLFVNIWFVMGLAEIPDEATVVGGTSGTERLLTLEVSPARAEVWMD